MEKDKQTFPQAADISQTDPSPQAADILQTDPILNLRQHWIENGCSLTDKDLGELDRIMRSETGLGFKELEADFNFRFSGIIVKPGPIPLNDDYILTEYKGKRQLYVLPGGKMSAVSIPFSALFFALFWAKSHEAYEKEISGSGEASLVRLLSSEEGVKKYVLPLEELARKIDRPFGLSDNYSEIRREGYREFKEEFDLEGFGLGGEEEIADELNEEEQTNCCINSAEPISVYLSRYKGTEGSDGVVAKKWFVSFNYLIDIPGSMEVLTRVLMDSSSKKGEVRGLRWARLTEVTLRGYDDYYYPSIHYVTRRMEAQGKIGRIIPASLRTGPEDHERGSLPGEIIVPNYFTDRLDAREK